MAGLQSSAERFNDTARIRAWCRIAGVAIALLSGSGCGSASPAQNGSTGGSSGEGGVTGGGAGAGGTGNGGSSALGGSTGTGGQSVEPHDAATSDATADRPRGADATVDSAGPGVDGGSPPPFGGATVTATVTVNRAMQLAALGPGFAGFSFEKSHMTDGFFTGANAPLIALFRLLGPGIVRIGANDVDRSVWQPTAAPVAGGTTTNNVGTADVDALAAFLTATAWHAIYGVNMKTSTPAQAVAEATYVASKLGASLDTVEIGNEINFFGAYATVRPQWEPFADAIKAALPAVSLAAPATAGDLNFSVMFARDEASRISMLTHHYYRGGAGSATATLANLLAPDPLVTTQSQGLAAAVTANGIREGFRWGEMNSFSGHGQAGVSDVFGAALWSIDFMLTTAQLGSRGVNFHGGGQNMDGNVCNNGVASCTRPFRYSPIIEVDSRVTGAAPLFYGMLLVSQVSAGTMLATRVTVQAVNLTAYAVAAADGSTDVVLVNKDAATGANATIDVGKPVLSATGAYLTAPALTSTTGITLRGASVSAAGNWAPAAPYNLAASGNTVSLVVPPASAILIRAR